MSMQIFYNPKCSKCRMSLEILEEKDLKLEIIEYLTTSPSLEALAAIVAKLGIKAVELIRFNESTAKELNIQASDAKSDTEWLEIMVNHPILIERPIVIKGDQAVIGRPPSKVLELV